jgi:hypothetical protein
MSVQFFTASSGDFEVAQDGFRGTELEISGYTGNNVHMCMDNRSDRASVILSLNEFDIFIEKCQELRKRLS